jgi:hypothetical protein
MGEIEEYRKHSPKMRRKAYSDSGVERKNSSSKLNLAVRIHG